MRVRAGVEAADPWDGAVGELNRNFELSRELDEIDVDVSIAEAQIELDSADERPSFEAAVRRLIDAYRAYAELLEGRPEQASEGILDRRNAIVESIHARTAAAVEALRRYRDLSNEVSGSLRAAVLAALDDLNRSAAQGRSNATSDG